VMDQDPLIAYRWEDFTQLASILLLVGLVGAVTVLKNSFEGSFFIEATLFVVLLTSGAIAIMAMAIFLGNVV
jgi:hypothetical protein